MNANGVANQKKMLGLFVEFIKGQKNPNALTIDVARREVNLIRENLKISEVLIHLPLEHR